MACKRSRGGPGTPRRVPPALNGRSSGPPPPRRRRILHCSVWGEGVGTRPTIKRLARRGGVKRISGLMCEESRSYLQQYVQGLVQASAIHTGHSYRTTITAADVTHALRRSGTILYGFGT
ncbi:histone H4 replacement-like protein [Mycena metata]|uniref:Histone H4 n=1 Tax=Mycena metata TaxID=1033252 RepID=A0AAD7NFZ6_9AGAR|nr:histone H4 replacement-like protein [Mycena metata]